MYCEDRHEGQRNKKRDDEERYEGREAEDEEIEADDVPDGGEADEIAVLGLALLVGHMEQARQDDGDAGRQAGGLRQQVGLAEGEGGNRHVGEEIDDQREAEPDEHPLPIAARRGDERKQRKRGAGRGKKVDPGRAQALAHARFLAGRARRKPKEAPPDGAVLEVALDLAAHGKVFIVFRWRDLLKVSGLRFAVKQLEAEIELGQNAEAEDFRPAALLRRLRRAGCGGLQLHGRVLGLRRELQDLGRSFLGLFKGECGRSPDQQGSNYASRKRTIPHGPLSAHKMSACSLDFKPVAKAVKGLLRQENSRRSTNVCGTVATALRPTFAEPRAGTRKKDRPEGRS